MLKEEKELRDLIRYPCTIKQSDWLFVSRSITALVRAVREGAASTYESMTYPQDRNPKIAAAIREGRK